MLMLEDLYQLATAATQDEWYSLLLGCAGKLGFAELLFGFKLHRDLSNSTARIFSNYTEKWRLKYDEENFADIDPTVRHCFQSNIPILWSEDIYRSPSEKAFYEDARQYGLKQGITMPIHGASGMLGTFSLKFDNIASSEYRSYLNKHFPHISSLRDCALEGAVRLFCNNPNESVHLTNREREVLIWGSTGKTTWEISKILSCSESNINFHFSNIRRKFGVSSRQLAIVKAIQMQIISI